MKNITLIILLLTLFSCEKQLDWEFNPSENQFIIVESIITNENKQHEVKLSYSVQNLNELPLAVSNAEISLNDGTHTYIFTEKSDELGTYLSDDNFIAVVNRTYELSVKIEDEIYTATSNMLPVNDFELMTYTQISDSVFKFSSSLPQFLPNENSMYEVLVDWSDLPLYSDSSFSQTHKLLYFYSLSSLDVPEIFAPESETVFFPRGSIVTERKYSLTPQHAEFIRSLLLETSWRGGAFDIEQGNITTNFSNGAYGYFGVCSVIEKTFVVE